MAVCPTKNNDRFEWFAEKATELGVDVINPVIGDHSERKVFKTDRLKRILLSASKQSLKGAVPQVEEPLPLRGFIRSCKADLKLICCCYEGEEKRVSIEEVLSDWGITDPSIVVLIGPEGDFSREEVALALECGFRPVHLGPSRLRTETAALAAVAAVYFHYCGDKGM
jgi:16S rRNA (uracil1498-N3)-methyltransferase